MSSEFESFQKTNRSAFANFLRSKYEMYEGKEMVESYPYYLTLEPSDKCQLRCPTCVTGIENETRLGKGETHIFRDQRSQLTPAMMEGLLGEMGEYLFLLTLYNFGEPLLNRDLPQLIRMAKAHDIETDVNTNLSVRLSDERIEELLTSGLDYLFVSIDGFSQETYQVHRVGGDIELIKSNLERMVRTRDRVGSKTTITYNFLVFSFNEHELGDAQHYCDDLGIGLNRRDAFVHNPDWLPSYRRGEAPSAVPAEVELPAPFSYKSGGQVMAWSPLPQVKARPQRCSWHYGYSAISAGGHVSPCCAVPDQKNDFGIVAPGRTSFAEVWNNQKFRKSRADFSGTAVRGGQSGDTICTRCPVPEFIFHLYSPHDFKVISRFHDVLAGSDAVMDEAFELFSVARYGHRIQPLVEGAARDFFGSERPGDIDRFVAFYRENVLVGTSPVPGGRGTVTT